MALWEEKKEGTQRASEQAQPEEVEAFFIVARCPENGDMCVSASVRVWRKGALKVIIMPRSFFQAGVVFVSDL